ERLALFFKTVAQALEEQQPKDEILVVAGVDTAAQNVRRRPQVTLQLLRRQAPFLSRVRGLRRNFLGVSDGIGLRIGLALLARRRLVSARLARARRLRAAVASKALDEIRLGAPAVIQLQRAAQLLQPSAR